MGILALFGFSKEASFIKDAEKLLRVCRSFGPMERGHLDASVKMALGFMLLDRETDRSESLMLALEAMQTRKQLTRTEVGKLSAYNLRLMNLQREAHRSTSPINRSIAAGLPVWITCNRALFTVALQPHVRELWSIIGSGDQIASYDLVEAAVRQLGPHPLAERMQGARSLTTPAAFAAC